jgi:DNA-binding NarL/FixJ family response regulator
LYLWQLHRCKVPPEKMKFLIVDDHALIRDAMRVVVLEICPDARVLVASNALEALTFAASHTDIDLVLLDVNLPDRDGLDVLAELRRRYPATSVAMLSGTKDQQTIMRALSLGAVGFIPKAETREVLLGALGLILKGGIYIPPAALAAAQAPPVEATRPDAPPTPASPGLTDRQMDVLALMMRGKSNKLICRELDLAEPTVKNHVSAILKSLGVNTRTEAVLSVTKLGWRMPDLP